MVTEVKLVFAVVLHFNL